MNKAIHTCAHTFTSKHNVRHTHTQRTHTHNVHTHAHKHSADHLDIFTIHVFCIKCQWVLMSSFTCKWIHGHEYLLIKLHKLDRSRNNNTRDNTQSMHINRPKLPKLQSASSKVGHYKSCVTARMYTLSDSARDTILRETVQNMLGRSISWENLRCWPKIKASGTVLVLVVVHPYQPSLENSYKFNDLQYKNSQY